MFCTQYSFLPAFFRFVQNVGKANAGISFLVYSACMNCFSLNLPLHEFFFCTSPAPHNFSNGPSLTRLSRQLVTAPLLQIMSFPPVTTSNGTILRFWRMEGLAFNVKFKRTLLIQNLNPTFSVNVGNVKLFLY